MNIKNAFLNLPQKMLVMSSAILCVFTMQNATADFVEDDPRVRGTYSQAIRDLVRMTEEELEDAYIFAKRPDQNWKEDVPPGDAMGLAVQSDRNFLYNLFLRNNLVSKAFYASLWNGKTFADDSESLENRAAIFTGLIAPNARMKAYPADVYLGQSSFDMESAIIVDYWFPEAGLGWFLPGLFTLFRDEQRPYAINDEGVKTHVGITFLRFSGSRTTAPRRVIRFLWYFLDFYPDGNPRNYNYRDAGISLMH